MVCLIFVDLCFRYFFFFKQKTEYEMRISDWSSGVCSSDLVEVLRWIQSGGIDIEWAFRIDTLTAVMFVVVNTVSTLVHIYSIGYMHHDPHRPRFFAYLSLFTFAMLMLVTADNLAQMFFGWEGVGLESYLLLGFWYKKPSASAAALKAFIVNRLGDFRSEEHTSELKSL